MASAVLVAIVGAALAACTGLRPGPNERWPQIVRYAQPATLVNGVYRGTATCGADEHLIAGGYRWESGSVADVVDSYPSTADGSAPGDGAEVTSWTAAFLQLTLIIPNLRQAAAAGPPEVYAACVKGETFTTHAYSESNTVGTTLTPLSVQCPSGTELTGGGFRTDWAKDDPANQLASVPDLATANTWTVYERSASATNGTAYALCVAWPDLSVKTVTGESYRVVESVAPCPTPSPGDIQLCLPNVSAPVTAVRCSSGFLLSGALQPFPGAAPKALSLDPSRQLSTNQPDQLQNSAAASAWNLQLAATVNNVGSYVTVLLCGSLPLVATSSAAAPIVSPSGPSASPSSQPTAEPTPGWQGWLTGLERHWSIAAIAVLLLLVLIIVVRVIADILRAIRGGRGPRGRIPRQQPPVPAALIRVVPGEPVDTIELGRGSKPVVSYDS